MALQLNDLQKGKVVYLYIPPILRSYPDFSLSQHGYIDTAYYKIGNYPGVLVYDNYYCFPPTIDKNNDKIVCSDGNEYNILDYCPFVRADSGEDYNDHSPTILGYQLVFDKLGGTSDEAVSLKMHNLIFYFRIYKYDDDNYKTYIQNKDYTNITDFSYNLVATISCSGLCRDDFSDVVFYDKDGNELKSQLVVLKQGVFADFLVCFDDFIIPFLSTSDIDGKNRLSAAEAFSKAVSQDVIPIKVNVCFNTTNSDVAYRVDTLAEYNSNYSINFILDSDTSLYSQSFRPKLFTSLPLNTQYAIDENALIAREGYDSIEKTHITLPENYLTDYRTAYIHGSFCRDVAIVSVIDNTLELVNEEQVYIPESNNEYIHLFFYFYFQSFMIEPNITSPVSSFPTSSTYDSSRYDTKNRIYPNVYPYNQFNFIYFFNFELRKQFYFNAYWNAYISKYLRDYFNIDDKPVYVVIVSGNNRLNLSFFYKCFGLTMFNADNTLSRHLKIRQIENA